MRLKFFCVLIACALGAKHPLAQSFNADSVKLAIASGKEDTAKVRSLAAVVNYYNRYQQDSSMRYVQQMIRLSQKINYPYGEAWGYILMATTLDRGGNFTHSLEMSLKCLKIAENLTQGKEQLISMSYAQIGLLEGLNKDRQSSIQHLNEALKWARMTGNPESQYYQIYTHLGNAYWQAKQIDSAFVFAQTGYDIAQRSSMKVFLPYACNIFGIINLDSGDSVRAKQLFKEGIVAAIRVNHVFQLAFLYNRMSYLFSRENQFDSAIYYSKNAMALSQFFSFGQPLLEASSNLTKLYEFQNKNDSVLKYLRLLVAVKDSVFSQARAQQFQLLSFEEGQRQQQLKIAETAYRNKIITYGLSFILILLLITAIILLRNNRQKQRANAMLDKQKKDLQDTLVELKSTQTQLIQSEKMASLGELTAGIAHEIQNPLNFVNNFSDVNQELIAELEQEIEKGNYGEVKIIARDIVTNEVKINEHGKRADAIVKSMLQHSSGNTGQKEPTDINALCEEFLRLSYHGMRAKDKGLNAVLKTDFDPSVSKLNIVPQEIGRVLLNLYNNAFYALSAKSAAVALPTGQAGLANGEAQAKANSSYQPTVIVSTLRKQNNVIITVSDNGIGIPDELKDKIFQPFFTTKPTGQGTGLGLSLSYDIVKKGHNGDLKMESVPMAGSTFKIILAAS